jgi:hypothetical protein
MVKPLKGPSRLRDDPPVQPQETGTLPCAVRCGIYCPYEVVDMECSMGKLETPSGMPPHTGGLGRTAEGRLGLCWWEILGLHSSCR